jgi:hypothetical protein
MSNDKMMQRWGLFALVVVISIGCSNRSATTSPAPDYCANAMLAWPELSREEALRAEIHKHNWILASDWTESSLEAFNQWGELWALCGCLGEEVAAELPECAEATRIIRDFT